MRELLHGASGTQLLGNDYWDDFNDNFWKTSNAGFWKLERIQSFRESGNGSWGAFLRGDWAESLRLMEEQRSALSTYYNKIEDHGFRTRRVRVVEKPICPYLQWELHFLRLRDELGGATRVVDLHQVAQFESSGMLPEIIVLGSEVMYELVYDETGLQQGGIRFTDKDLIKRWSTFISELYSSSEDIQTFFDREVAGLEPPRGD
ncbi:hypothetical protein GCM10010174_88630 [Kutzneria viridogrisea]|uniref:DUF6879 domain-containing protein n=1 Tax=Kutzneria viridogrisea TaxID=47990 RepID=A0ABR6BJS1_9PSEU|nr:hypothetical protein [Kutzneria viridogrisea]